MCREVSEGLRGDDRVLFNQGFSCFVSFFKFILLYSLDFIAKTDDFIYFVSVLKAFYFGGVSGESQKPFRGAPPGAGNVLFFYFSTSYAFVIGVFFRASELQK